MPTQNRGAPIYSKDLRLSSSIDNSRLGIGASNPSASNSQVVHQNRVPLGAIERKEFDLRTALREFEKKQKRMNKVSKSVEFHRPPFRASTSDLSASYIEAPVAEARPVEGSRVLFSDSTVNSPCATAPTTPKLPTTTVEDDISTNSLHSIISHNSLFRARDKDSVQKYMAELSPSVESLPPPESVELSQLTNTFTGDGADAEDDLDDDDIDFEALRNPVEVPMFSFDIKYNNLSQWKAMSVQPKITSLKYKIIEDIMVREGLLIKLKSLIELLDRKYWEYAALRVRKCTEQLVRQNSHIPVYNLGKPEEFPPAEHVYDPVKSRQLVRKQNRILILQNELGIAIALHREVTLAIIEKTMKMRVYFKREFKTRSEISIYWNNENYFAKIYQDMHIFHSTITVRMYVGFQEFSPLFIPPESFDETTLQTRHDFMQSVYEVWLKKHKEKVNRDRLLKHRIAYDNKRAKRANASLMTTDRRYLMDNLGVVQSAPTPTAATSAAFTTSATVTIVDPSIESKKVDGVNSTVVIDTESSLRASADSAVQDKGVAKVEIKLETIAEVVEAQSASEVPAVEAAEVVAAAVTVPTEGVEATDNAVTSNNIEGVEGADPLPFLKLENPEDLVGDVDASLLLEQERELMMMDDGGLDLNLPLEDEDDAVGLSFENMLEAMSRKGSQAVLTFDDELPDVSPHTPGGAAALMLRRSSSGEEGALRASPVRTRHLSGGGGVTPEVVRTPNRLKRSATEDGRGGALKGSSPSLRSSGWNVSIAATAESERSKPTTPSVLQRSQTVKISPLSNSRPNSRSFQFGRPFPLSDGGAVSNASESLADMIAASLDRPVAPVSDALIGSEVPVEDVMVSSSQLQYELPTITEAVDLQLPVETPIVVTAASDVAVDESDVKSVSSVPSVKGLTIEAPVVPVSGLKLVLDIPITHHGDDGSVPSQKSEEHHATSPTAAVKFKRDTKSPPKPLMEWQQLRDYAGFSWEQNPETLIFEQCSAHHLMSHNDNESLASAHSLLSNSAFWNNLDQNPYVVEAVVGFKELFPVKLIVPPMPEQLKNDCIAAESILEHELDLMDEIRLVSEEASMLKSKLDVVANSEVVQMISEQSLMNFYNHEPCEEADRLLLRQQGNSELLTGISVEHFGSSMFEEMNVAYDIPTPHKSLILGSEYSQLLPNGGSNSMMHDDSQVFLTDSIRHNPYGDNAAAAQLAQNTLNNSLSEYRSEFKPHSSMQSSFQAHGSYVDTRDLEAFRIEKSSRTRERIESRIDEARSFVEYDAKKGVNQLKKDKLGRREIDRSDDRWVLYNVVKIQCRIRIKLARMRVQRLRTARSNFRRIIYVQKFLRGFLGRKAAARRKYEFKKKMFIIRKMAIGKLRAALIITRAIREFINWKRQQAGLTTFLRGYSRAAKRVKKERKRIRTILKPGVERMTSSRERDSLSRGSVSDSEGGSRSRSTSPLRQKSSLLAEDNEFSHSFAMSFDGSIETRLENSMERVMTKAIAEAEKIVNGAMLTKEHSNANMSSADSLSTAAKLNRFAVTKEKQKNEMSMVTAELEKMQLNAKMQALALVHRVNKDKVILDTVYNSRLIPMKTVEHVNRKVRKFSTKEYAFLTTNNNTGSANNLLSHSLSAPSTATSGPMSTAGGEFGSTYTRPLSLLAMEKSNAEALERIYQGPIPSSKKSPKKTLRTSHSTSKILSQTGGSVLPALAHSTTTSALHSPPTNGRRDSVYSAESNNSANKSINSNGGVSLFTATSTVEQKPKHRSHTDIMEARAKAQSEMETIHMKNVLRNYF